MILAGLCSLGVKWLRGPASQAGPGCNVAASECIDSCSGETTDAIGFRSVGSSNLAMALAGDADYLVTGDRRAGLLQRGRFGRTRIVTPGAFCAESQKPAYN